MKVGILATAFPRRQNDWVGASVYELCRKLVLEGLEVVVVAPHQPGLKTREEWGGVTVHRFKYMFPARCQIFSYEKRGLLFHLQGGIIAKFQFILYLVFFSLKSIVVCRDVDLIHAQWLPSGLVAVLIKKLLKKPVVLTPRGFSKGYSLCFPEKEAGSPKTRFLKRIVKFTLSGCDRVCATSSEVGRLIGCFESAGDKVAVIPNWIDIDQWPVIDKNRAKDGLGLDRNTKLILFVGRLSPEKGLEYLIEAIAILPDTKAAVVLIGLGPDRERLSRLIERKNLSTRVKILGAVPHTDIPSWMQSADIFVLPSLYEEFGVVLLEAMASGTPVIGTFRGGIPDILTPDVGFAIPPQNAEILAEKIRVLLKNDPLRLEMGRKARERVERHFTWPAIRARLFSVYREAGQPSFSGGKLDGEKGPRADER